MAMVMQCCEKLITKTKARFRCLSLAAVLSDQNTVAKDRRLPSTFLFSYQFFTMTLHKNRKILIRRKTKRKILSSSEDKFYIVKLDFPS